MKFTKLVPSNRKYIATIAIAAVVLTSIALKITDDLSFWRNRNWVGIIAREIGGVRLSLSKVDLRKNQAFEMSCDFYSVHGGGVERHTIYVDQFNKTAALYYEMPYKKLATYPERPDRILKGWGVVKSLFIAPHEIVIEYSVPYPPDRDLLRNIGLARATFTKGTGPGSIQLKVVANRRDGSYMVFQHGSKIFNSKHGPMPHSHQYHSTVWCDRIRTSD